MWAFDHHCDLGNVLLSVRYGQVRKDAARKSYGWISCTVHVANINIGPHYRVTQCACNTCIGRLARTLLQERQQALDHFFLTALRHVLRQFIILCSQMTDQSPSSWRTQAPTHGAENRTLFNTKLPNVWKNGSFGLGRRQNWGWYFVWTPGTYRLIGRYDLASSTGARKGRRRSSGLLPT